MSSLSQEEKEVILDFYFRCGSEGQINQGQDLIAGNAEAAELYGNLERTLKRLDSAKYEPCPDNLAELTISRLKSAGQGRLKELLEIEQDHAPVTAKRSFWRNGLEVASMAAIILVAIGVLFPVSANMRQVALRNKCSSHLGRVGAGIAGYANDYNGSLPAVAMSPGSPWWKVGDQGEKNQSNTRHLWVLVKNNYVDGKNFLCPNRKDAEKIKLAGADINNYNDFLSRQSVHYSFIFMCDKSAKRDQSSKLVLMADRNPVFEKVIDGKRIAYQNRDKFTVIMINDQLRKMMSTNHRGKGQNVLFGDGHVKFLKSRIVNNDDIYTIRGAGTYSGCEVPCDDEDVFLAP